MAPERILIVGDNQLAEQIRASARQASSLSVTMQANSAAIGKEANSIAGSSNAEDLRRRALAIRQHAAQVVLQAAAAAACAASIEAFAGIRGLVAESEFDDEDEEL